MEIFGAFWKPPLLLMIRREFQQLLSCFWFTYQVTMRVFSCFTTVVQATRSLSASLPPRSCVCVWFTFILRVASFLLPDFISLAMHIVQSVPTKPAVILFHLRISYFSVCGICDRRVQQNGNTAHCVPYRSCSCVNSTRASILQRPRRRGW